MACAIPYSGLRHSGTEPYRPPLYCRRHLNCKTEGGQHLSKEASKSRGDFCAAGIGSRHLSRPVANWDTSVMSSFVQYFKSWNQVFAGLPLRRLPSIFPCITISPHWFFFGRCGQITSSPSPPYSSSTPILSNTHLFVLLSTHDTLNSLRSLSLSPKLIPATVLLCSPLRGPMTPAVVY